MERSKEHGEGSYKGSRKYKESVEGFVSDEARVKKAAKEAKEAMSGDEKRDLERAEGEGRKHAREEDPELYEQGKPEDV